MPVTCAFGMQWGDEGKGRVVDLLARDADLVVRYQGGANAGHTVIVGKERYVLHLLPSGVLHPRTRNVLANGVVVDPGTFLQEIDEITRRGTDLTGRLFVSDRAHVVLPHHRRMDQALEALRGGSPLGTTSRGIGPTYGDKFRRAGLRTADLLEPSRFREALESNIEGWNAVLDRAGMETVDVERTLEETRRVGERLRPWVADTGSLLFEAWRAGKRILCEGAQGFGLDVDHGSYPFVTSSTTGPAGVSAGTGLPPRALDRVVGIAKAYTTRVGTGPFPTRLNDAAGRHLSQRGQEFGATTGRPRDCGWFDAVLTRAAVRTQGVDAVALTKLDVLSGLEELLVCTAYRIRGRTLDLPPAWAGDWEAVEPHYVRFEGWSSDLSGVRRFGDLPAAAQAYVRALRELMDTPIELIGVGAEREQFIPLPEPLAIGV